MPLSLVTRLLIVAVAIRLGADCLGLNLRLSLLQEMPAQDAWRVVRTTVAPWALQEFPQVFVYIVDIIMVEGLYRIWRNLRRAKTNLAVGATQ